MKTNVYLFLNINQLDALNFIISLFQSLYMVRAHVLIVRRAKIVLYSLRYHHTETSEWSKIKTSVYVRQYLARLFLAWRIFYTNIVEKPKT